MTVEQSYIETLEFMAQVVPEGYNMGAVSVIAEGNLRHTKFTIWSPGRIFEFDFSFSHQMAFPELYRAGICESNGRNMPQVIYKVPREPDGTEFTFLDFRGESRTMHTRWEVRAYELEKQQSILLPHRMTIAEFDLEDDTDVPKHLPFYRIGFNRAAVFFLSDAEVRDIRIKAEEDNGKNLWKPPFSYFSAPPGYNCSTYGMDRLGFAAHLGICIENRENFMVANVLQVIGDLVTDVPPQALSIYEGTVERRVGTLPNGQQVMVLDCQQALEIYDPAEERTRTATLLDTLTEMQRQKDRSVPPRSESGRYWTGFTTGRASADENEHCL